MEPQPSPSDSPRRFPQSLADLVAFEYRSLVAHRLGVTAEWRGLEWIDNAACLNHVQATERLCTGCPVVAPCLAAAIVTDDPAEWRGGLTKADRASLWAGMERTYRDVRDLELMRVDATHLTHRRITQPAGRTPKPHRA